MFSSVMLILFVILSFVAYKVQEVALVVPVGETLRTAKDYARYRQRVEKAIKNFRKNNYSKIIIISNEDLDPQRPLKAMTDFVRELIAKESIHCDVILGCDPPSCKWEMAEI